jgi:hypothetical protein
MQDCSGQFSRAATVSCHSHPELRAVVPRLNCKTAVEFQGLN